MSAKGLSVRLFSPATAETFPVRRGINPLLYDLRHSAGIQDIVPAKSPALALEPSC